MFFGGGGNEPGRLNLPAKVVVDYTSVPYFKKLAHDFDVEYIVLVSSQYGPRKINVYAFGKPSGSSPDKAGGSK